MTVESATALAPSSTEPDAAVQARDLTAAKPSADGGSLAAKPSAESGSPAAKPSADSGSPETKISADNDLSPAKPSSGGASAAAKPGAGTDAEEVAGMGAGVGAPALSRASALAAARAAAADDDPASELNQLRRQVRELQGAVRAARLQAAAHEDEVLALRDERDAALAREAALQASLVSERSRVAGTMAAAEALVANLRELEADAQADPGDDQDDGDGDGDGLTGAPALGPIPEGSVLRDPKRSRSKTLSPCSPQSPRKRASFPSAAARPRTGPAALTRSAPAVMPRPSSAAVTATLASSDVVVVDPTSKPSSLLAAAFSPKNRTGSPNVVSPRSPDNSTDSTQGLPPLSLASAAGVTEKHSHMLRGPAGEGVSSGGSPTSSALAKMSIAFSCTDLHEGNIFALAATCDGGVVASGGDDRVVRVFDVEHRRCVAKLTECARAVTALAFEASGGLLTAGSYDGFLRFWRYDATRRRSKWVLEKVQPAHSAAIRKVLWDTAAAADAPRLYSASSDRTVKLTDVSVGKRPFVGTSPSAIFDMDVHHGHGTVITGHKDGGLRVWSSRDSSGAIVSSAKVHERAITTVCCLEDGYGVLTLGREGTLKLNDLRKPGETVREMGGIKVESDWHRATLVGRDVICGLGPSGAVGHWNVDSGKFLGRKMSSEPGRSEGDVLGLLRSTPGCVILPVWTPRNLVTAHSNRQISFWH